MLNNILLMAPWRICFLLLLPLLFNSTGECQIYSDDQLIRMGKSAYDSHEYPLASVYLFAYIQKSPPLMSANAQFAADVWVAYNHSLERVKQALQERDQLKVQLARSGSPDGGMEQGELSSRQPALNIPGQARMGPLQYGVVYLQADLYSRPSTSPEQCAALCRDEVKCKAMTYIKSQRLCWIKDSVPATASSNDMVSAVKEPN